MKYVPYSTISVSWTLEDCKKLSNGLKKSGRNTCTKDTEMLSMHRVLLTLHCFTTNGIYPFLELYITFKVMSMCILSVRVSHDTEHWYDG